MPKNYTHPNHTSSSQDTNIPNISSTNIPKVDEYYHPGLGKTCEIFYKHIWAIQPTICRFEKAIGLIRGVHKFHIFQRRTQPLLAG